MPPFSIRPAVPADAPSIAEIYNQGVAERQATFETEPRSAEELAAAVADGKPYLVAVRDGAVAGWASLSQFSDRACYDGVSEVSVYLDRDVRGRGIGRVLLDSMAEEAVRLGHWKLIGLIFPANRASVALFRGAGYREVGVFERHGRLDGDWRDVLIVERHLGEAPDREPSRGDPSG
jgi:phosphinothricin acetyltransferase